VPGPDEGRAAAKVVEYAIGLVAARSWPEKKLREKMLARHEAGHVDAALVRLRELGLVDDVAWAERFARDRFERGAKGRHRIRAELAAKGIDAATIDAALERAIEGEAERERAARLLESLRARLEGMETTPERLKNRLFRRMIARGYPVSLVRDLLDVS
jgi:regulatory protein